MSKPEQRSKIIENFSVYLYFSSLYFISVGVLYLWGYWASFDINILEYLSISDIFKTAAYPVVSSFIFLFILTLSSSYIYPPGEGANSRIGVFVNKYALYLYVLYLLLTITLFFKGLIIKWMILPLLFSLPLTVMLERKGLFNSLIQSYSIRYIFILLMTSLPMVSYGRGSFNAEEILEGKNYKYVTSQIEGLAISDNALPAQRLRYIGQAGDFIFLLSPGKNTLIITKYEQIKILQLKKL